MVKLKIGTGTTTKKQKSTKRMDDYFSDLSDKEIEDIQIEVEEDEESDEIEEVIKEEVEEIVRGEVDKLLLLIPEQEKEEEEMKEAVNGVFILDEVGINIKYAEKYATLFPKKKVVYRNYFTKAFLKWYITNAKIALVKKLYIIESDYVKPEQKDYIMGLITKRMKAPVEVEDNAESVMRYVTASDLTTELETEMYEFLLSEKWDSELSDKRAEGITQLDKILEEQMRLKECDMTQALKNAITGFKLETKWYNIGKKEVGYDDSKKEVVDEDIPNIIVSNAEKSKEMDRSIKRFHHIKFLYELMGSDKFKLTDIELTDEEIEHIEQIDHLLNDREELKIVEEAEKKGVERFG